VGKMFTFEVVTPERIVTREDVESLIVPGADGYLGVLADHAPMVVLLRPGVVKYRRDAAWQRMAVSGGYLEVAAGNKAVVLAPTAERAEEIDRDRAGAARRRAEERLRARRREIDPDRAQIALQRALARLHAAEG